MEALDLGARWKRAKIKRRQLARGITAPVDAGGQVDPLLRAPAEALSRNVKISAVILHPLSLDEGEDNKKAHEARHRANIEFQAKRNIARARIARALIQPGLVGA